MYHSRCLPFDVRITETMGTLFIHHDATHSVMSFRDVIGGKREICFHPLACCPKALVLHG